MPKTARKVRAVFGMLVRMTETGHEDQTITIGLTGAIKHGKSTIAAHLAHLEHSSVALEPSLLITEVADAMHANIPRPIDPSDIDWVNTWLAELPDILRTVVRIDTTVDAVQITPRGVNENPLEFQKLFAHTAALSQNTAELTKPITPQTKEMQRPFLQWLGGYTVMNIDPGIWYNELLRRAESSDTKLRIIGGLRFKSDELLLRDAGAYIVKVVRPDAPEIDLSDPTERERESIKADTVITNNGSVVQLKATTSEFLNDLRAGKPKPVYISSN